tara:strand:+ start:7184 stop:9802 length:2619 start_codon:yes stop_codon:yes gene_type:complete
MYLKSKMRLLGMSALVSVGLVAATSANAYNIRLGGIDIQVDTTVSVGASMLLEDRETKYLPVSNGGSAETNKYFSLTDAVDTNADGKIVIADDVESAPDFASCANPYSYAKFCQDLSHAQGGTTPNFDGSINSDDGRLNFEGGDLYSAPIKLTSEFEASMGAFMGFARVNVFHDMVTMDKASFARGGELTAKGEDNMGQNIELLDAYVSYDGDVGQFPITIRAGKQVINWGEATFIPGGNSSFNPIDVAALRRPGAEIKEALLPVEALYGSIALTPEISIEAYVGGWDKYRLEAGGTPFGGSDSFTAGTVSGNPQDRYFIGGGQQAGRQFACDTAALTAAGKATTSSISTALQGITGLVDCANNPNMDPLKTWTVGSAEKERSASGDFSYVQGVSNKDGDESMGLAVRWYAENLNSTEFALYYQKGDSRLPYISYNSGKASLNVGSTGATSSTVGRGAGPQGCMGMVANLTNGAPNAQTGKLYNVAAGTTTKLNDPHGLLSDATLNYVADQTAAVLNVGLAALGGYSRDATLAVDSAAKWQELQCLLAIAQKDGAKSNGSAFDGQGQLSTGTTNVVVDYNLELFAEFPEVETMGISFNTTAFGWGVQGDFSYRPEVPLQFDTDVLTIAGLFNNCAFASVGVFEGVYKSGSTYNNEFGNVGCSDKQQYLKGYTTDHDATTWDIGTTATFTRSNPLMSLLGADLGILLTEFQGVMVDGIEEKRGDPGTLGAVAGVPNPIAGITPLANTCTAGSDLPLNGILSIDDRNLANADGFCRPTDESSGMVLLARLQYNNVFGTPWSLAPTVVHNVGLNGNSPSPIGFWREDVSSTAVSVTGTYLGKIEASLAFRTYGGDIERTKNLDRDNLSISVSYAY